MIETPEKASILIVDDRPEKVLALEAVLEDLGQNIVRAYSGREALRQVLNHEFAVILLDVNMPGMDGFETASMIRQRQSSRHVPIIFITAFGDEIHAARGYQLGAVDYILAPVVPEVLQTKVRVFVDLYRTAAQVKRQAESLSRRATQHQKLAAAFLSINSALSIDRMLQTVTDAARDVMGCHQAITLFMGDHGSGLRSSGPTPVCSFSEQHADWHDRKLDLAPVVNSVVARSRGATRLTVDELMQHPDWSMVSQLDIPPIRGGMIAAPFTGRNGDSLGIIYVTDPIAGPFTEDDEAVIVQLAQMASIAIENTIYSQEREANRLKDEFLATLSHELRTPLNAILGWTQLLRMEPLEGDVAHGLEVIERNVRSQTKLVEDLLDVSRITSGKMRLNTRPTPIAQVVRAATDAVRPAIAAKHIDFVYEGPQERNGDTDAAAAGDAEDDQLVIGDADRLQQVVWNLLANAAKFTPAGGRITVRLDHDDAIVRLQVSDTGHGIDPKFLPYVFDRFRQADSTSTRAHSGLGVGLAIVRHIVELHGGTVNAASEGLERGATFTVELPRCDETSPAAAPQRAAPVADTTVAPGGPVPTVPPDLHVLLVDDDPDARDLQTELLRRHGVRVTSAGSAEEALAELRRGLPHLLISDIAMPHRDGYDLIREVRRLPADEGGQLPAIALTAFARDDDRKRALSSGFNAHLAKPVDPAGLLLEVVRLTAADRATDTGIGFDATGAAAAKVEISSSSSS